MKNVPKFKKNTKNKAAAQLLRNSNIINIKKFQKKADILRTYCLQEGIFQNIAAKAEHEPYGVFLSVGNQLARALVLAGTGNTLEQAWDTAVVAAEKYLKNNPFEVCYVKADIVDTTEWSSLEKLNGELKKQN